MADQILFPSSSVELIESSEYFSFIYFLWCCCCCYCLNWDNYTCSSREAPKECSATDEDWQINRQPDRQTQSIHLECICHFHPQKSKSKCANEMYITKWGDWFNMNPNQMVCNSSSKKTANRTFRWRTMNIWDELCKEKYTQLNERFSTHSKGSRKKNISPSESPNEMKKQTRQQRT